MRDRPGYEIFLLFAFVICATWVVYHIQFKSLPEPLTAELAGKTGFSEVEAAKHVKALTQLGPHPVGSDALDTAVQYVLKVSETIKEKAHWEVDVEVELFHAHSGANDIVNVLSTGTTYVYSDLSHVLMRISPKYANRAEDNAILVSAHIDTVVTAEGAGDDTSSIAVMLELARGISQQAKGFKNSIIFFFNTGEEEGLNGAHSFITQIFSTLDSPILLLFHPWTNTLRLAINLEAIGLGGKSGIVQAGPDPWAVVNHAQMAKYPSAQIVSQDVFRSGIINSATDFQVYRDLGGLSGLDFAYAYRKAVYHTKNDKYELLKPGSLQHLGENILALLLQAAASTDLPVGKATVLEGKSDQDTVVYFDILGKYMIVYRQSFADLLNNAVILLSLLIWIASLSMGGYSAVVSFAFSLLSIVLMWICSIGFSVLVAFVLPLVSLSAVPFISSPLLVVGLFAAPALLGAFAGQHAGYLILQKYLSCTFSQTKETLPLAERWIFKAGLLQWLVILAVGHYFKIGSSYLAPVWLVSPAFAYGLLEALLSPAQLPLKTLTLLIGLSVPLLISSGVIVLLLGFLVGNLVRFVSNPGSQPEWMGSVVVAVIIAAIVCLTMVYLLSYIHNSGAKVPFIVATCILFGISLSMGLPGIIPPFTDDTARAVNVVHIVDATAGNYSGKQDPVSYISLFSNTPGNLITEAEQIGEGFVCGSDKPLDFVTFSTTYSCWTNKNAEIGWNLSDIPVLRVESDLKGDRSFTQILIDTKGSTRWCLKINTDEVEDFQLSDDSEELVLPGEKDSRDGRHTIQFAGGKKSPTKFNLTLFWHKNQSHKNQGRH